MFSTGKIGTGPSQTPTSKYERLFAKQMLDSKLPSRPFRVNPSCAHRLGPTKLARSDRTRFFSAQHPPAGFSIKSAKAAAAGSAPWSHRSRAAVASVAPMAGSRPQPTGHFAPEQAFRAEAAADAAAARLENGGRRRLRLSSEAPGPAGVEVEGPEQLRRPQLPHRDH